MTSHTYMWSFSKPNDPREGWVDRDGNLHSRSASALEVVVAPVVVDLGDYRDANQREPVRESIVNTNGLPAQWRRAGIWI